MSMNVGDSSQIHQTATNLANSFSRNFGVTQQSHKEIVRQCFQTAASFIKHGLSGLQNAGGLSGLLFPLLTGRLVDKISYTPVFIMVAIMPLLGTISLFVLGRKYRQHKDLTVSQLDI